MRFCLKKSSICDERPNTFRGLRHRKYTGDALDTSHKLLGISRKLPRGFFFVFLLLLWRERIRFIPLKCKFLKHMKSH